MIQTKTIEVVVLMAIASVGVMGTGTLIQHALAASVHVTCSTLSCTEATQTKASSTKSTENPKPTETIHFNFEKIQLQP